MGLFDIFTKDDIAAVGDDRQVLPIREYKQGEGSPSEVSGIGPVIQLQRDLSTFILGEPNAGKTSTFELLAKQLDPRPDEPVVILDFKSNLDEKGFYDRDTDVILSAYEEVATHRWNIFEDLKTQQDYRVAAESLAVGMVNNEDGFFKRNAIDMFRSALVYIDNSDTYTHPTNRDLRNFFKIQESNPIDKRRTQLQEYNGELSREIETRPLVSGSGQTSANVFQSAGYCIDNNFVGAFDRDGEFSIQEYLDDPDGRRLVLDMNRNGQYAEAAYRLALDYVLHYADNYSSKYVYVLLDEFNQLGQLLQLDDFMKTVRESKGQAIIGAQSVTDVEDVYGEKTAKTVLENAPQKMLMKSTGQNVEYALNVIGQDRRIIDVPDPNENDGSSWISALSLIRWSPLGLALIAGKWIKEKFSEDDDPQSKPINVHPVPEDQFRQFNSGEAVIIDHSGEFAHVQLKEWKDLSEHARKALSGTETDSENMHLERRLNSIVDDPELSQADDLTDALFRETDEIIAVGLTGLCTLLHKRSISSEEVLENIEYSARELCDRVVSLATEGNTPAIRTKATAVLSYLRSEQEFYTALIERIDDIHANLHDSDEDVRIRTARMIVDIYTSDPEEYEYPTGEITDPLVQVAATAEDPQLSDAVDLTDALFEERYIQRMSGLLGLRQLAVADEAALMDTLSEAGYDGARLCNRLVALSTESDAWDVRFLATEVLNHAGVKFPDAIVERAEELCANLHVDDDDIRKSATILLAGLYLLRPTELEHVAAEIQTALVELADHQSPEVRATAAGLLAQMPETEPIRSALEDLRTDTHSDVRRAAADPQSAFEY